MTSSNYKQVPGSYIYETITLQECINGELAEEKLSVRCSQCQCKTGSRYTKMKKAPQVLTVQVKRFVFKCIKYNPSSKPTQKHSVNWPMPLIFGNKRA